jgi:c-di-GMP-binding flagellar brake protein YcgR
LNAAKTTQSAGVITRSGKEIERVLVSLYEYGEPVFAVLDEGKLLFRSLLLSVDSKQGCIIVEASEDEAVNTALLARPRATFMSNVEDLYLEFPAADPQRSTFLGKPAIQLRFPEVLVSHPRRVEPRTRVQRQPPLKCIADAEGIAAFESEIVDIGSGGIGFLVYTAGITLEPGTILKGCRIEQPGKKPVFVDLEVRYTLPVTLANGRVAVRSGCRFVNPSNNLLKLISSFMGVKA